MVNTTIPETSGGKNWRKGFMKAPTRMAAIPPMIWAPKTVLSGYCPAMAVRAGK